MGVYITTHSNTKRCVRTCMIKNFIRPRKPQIQLLIQIFMGIIKLQQSFLPIFRSTGGYRPQYPLEQFFSGVQNDDPNRILDRTRFPGYVRAHS